MDTFYINLWDDMTNGNGESYKLPHHVNWDEIKGRFISHDLGGFAVHCW